MLLCALKDSAGARTHIQSGEKQAALQLLLTLPHSLIAGKGQRRHVIFVTTPARGGLAAGLLGPVPLACRACQPCWYGPARALLLCIQKYL